jgi:hypothetical protein
MVPFQLTAELTNKPVTITAETSADLFTSKP